MSSNICAIIPAYNAAETIGSVVKGALKHLPLVLVADDGSSDGTADSAREAGAAVIIINKNKGKGNALKLLFKEAADRGYEAVISLDGDGQHNPSDIPCFLKARKQYPNQILVGSRMGQKEKIPRARYNSMHVARFFISLAANQYIEDTQSGFRLYPLNIIEKMILNTERYITETEILIKAGDMGEVIKPVGVNTIYGCSTSHFRPILDVTAITINIISYIWIKWFKEAITIDLQNTYRANNLKDKIGSNNFINKLFNGFCLLTILPMVFFYFLAYLCFVPFPKKNMASTRKLGISYFTILTASFLTPVILLIIIFEKICGFFGYKMRYVDQFLQKFYPNLWAK